MLLPQMPPAVNVNAWATGVPLVEMTPYVNGPSGEITSPVATSVATRLEALAVPRFLSGRLRVTVSPGSTTPLVGLQFSAATVQPLVTITGKVALTVRLTERMV